MKRLLLILLLIFPLSCYDGLSDMLDDVTMKVPICVDATGGDDGNDGRGWKNAKQTIQAAVNSADDGDEIWVAEGNYYVYDNPANGPGIIEISKRISIYGGFSGRESRLESRDSSDHVTKILADGATRLISFSNASGVIIDGFTIDGGYLAQTAIDISNSSGISIINCVLENSYTSISHSNSEVEYVNCRFYAISSEESGGAISANASIITIKNSVFDGCSSTSFGGAISAFNQSSITIIDTHFYRNNSPFGGAIYLIGTGTTLSVKDAVFGDKNVVFSGNRATNGGAIYASSGSEVNLTNTQFYRNSIGADGNPSGSEGGAIYVSGAQTSLKIQGSVFGDKDIAGSGNGVTGQGGAIYASGGSTVTISDHTEFYRNSVSEGPGGAIYVTNADTNFIIEDSFFGADDESSGNTATHSTNGGGGAIYANNKNSIIRRTEFKNNKGRLGGAIRYYTTDTGIGEITFCTFDKNESISTQGGAVFFDGTSDAELHITGSDFTRNKSATRGGAINIAGSVSKNVIIKDTDFGSDIETEGNSGLSGGAVNIEGPSSLTVINCDFKNNQTADPHNGGAISAYGNSIVNISSGSLFSKNKAFNGGALYAEGTALVEISESIFRGNQVSNNGGALSFNQTTASTVVNTYFYNNSAFNGGALYISGHDLHALVNLTFYLNSADNNGGAIYSLSNSIVYNNVFYGNTAGGHGANILANEYFTMRYCYFYQGIYSLSSSGPGNFTLVGVKINSGNPFASISPDASNFLYPSTALGEDGLINNGTVDFSAILPFTMPATDLAGRTRIVGGTDKIDIGAYERQ